MKKTYIPNEEDIEREWYVVDATGKILGRFASEVASILRGKNKPNFTPHLDTGDHIVVLNAEKISISGNKATQKMYDRYSGYPSGRTVNNFEQVRKEHPERIIKIAVKKMLPKNKLGKRMLKKLHVYEGDEHPHEAQQPQKLEL